LKEVLQHNSELVLVFEYFHLNLYQFYMTFREKLQSIPERLIRHLMRQTLEGLGHMHRNGYFHRDLKPENLLVYNNKLKIIDFGLVKEIRSRPPFTDYISTRWYRAPELLLNSTNYNSPVDIFALACIMVELYNLSPLFCGTSQVDQLFRIFKVMGTPSQAV